MFKRISIAVMSAAGLLLLFCAALATPLGAQQDPGKGPLAADTSAAEDAMQVQFAELPLYFIENQGQMDERVAYYVRGKDKTLYFTSQGLTWVLTDAESKPVDDARPPRPLSSAQRWIVKLDFLGANPDVRPVGEDETGAVISYFKGHPDEWRTGLKTYSRVAYRDLWPGIDLEYSGTVNRMKYQFVVQPGADPAQIRLAYSGATALGLGAEGQLQVSTPLGGFEDEAPYAYQNTGGGQADVDVAYVLRDGPEDAQAYGFRVGTYDKTKPLVLDPAVLVYCGYIGGSSSDYGYGIAVDGQGNAYVTGSTSSDETDNFPVTIGPDLTYNGSTDDVFVAKVISGGTSLAYCGYIGGSYNEQGYAIAVDASGNAYVTGWTNSTEDLDFPTIMGPDATHNGGTDAFVAAVRSTGTSLAYCGYIGGSDNDYGYGIAVDASGTAYVTGKTASSEATFPDTVGPDITHNGGTDAFVAKVAAGGSSLTYCGYIGGSGDDEGRSIALDDSGQAFVTGDTSSDQTTFPVKVGPDLTHNGGTDAFVAKLRAPGNGLVYCGYIGGSLGDQGRGIAVDGDGNAYVTGVTTSSVAAGFPVSVGPDLTWNLAEDAFVAKVNSGGGSLAYCGYIGGSDHDFGYGVAVDSDGNAYVTGRTKSSEGEGFPVATGPDLSYNYDWDAFVAKVKAAGTGLRYCGYIGGYYWDEAYGIALDRYGDAYVTGNTSSNEWQGFPVSVGPDLVYNEVIDAFVAKVSDWNSTPALGTVAPSSGSGPTGVTTYFTTTWQDADGWADLKQCYFHIGSSASIVNNVTLLYNAVKDRLWIRSDDGSAWLGGFAPGSLNTLENSQARVHCALTTMQGVGDTVEVKWAIEFKAGYTGAKKTGLKCKDRNNARAKAAWKGTWTVTSP
jgi:hypothetical protein